MRDQSVCCGDVDDISIAHVSSRLVVAESPETELLDVDDISIAH